MTRFYVRTGTSIPRDCACAEARSPEPRCSMGQGLAGLGGVTGKESRNSLCETRWRRKRKGRNDGQDGGSLPHRDCPCASVPSRSASHKLARRRVHTLVRPSEQRLAQGQCPSVHYSYRSHTVTFQITSDKEIHSAISKFVGERGTSRAERWRVSRRKGIRGHGSEQKGSR